MREEIPKPDPDLMDTQMALVEKLSHQELKEIDDALLSNATNH